MKKDLVLDTSIIMQYPDRLENNIDKYNYYISYVVASELDNLKESENINKSFKARRGLNFIDRYEKNINFIVNNLISRKLPNSYDSSINDNKIISVALDNDCAIATIDRGMKIKALALNIDVLDFSNEAENDYDGYKILKLNLHDDNDKQLLSTLYQNPECNDMNLLNNEYLVIKDTSVPVDDPDDEIIDILKHSSGETRPIKIKRINNNFLGKVKPRNLEQRILFDIMQDQNIKIKVTSGSFGTGKDYCQICNCLDLIEKNKFEKLIWIRNVVEVKNSGSIGFLPGSAFEKLLPYTMPLADKLGGEFGLETLINEGKIEIQHFSTIRGRDFRNSILYCTEIENMTKEHIQLIMSRVGEGSILVCNGDLEQVDSNVFRNNNGLKTMIDKLKGNKNFGYVKLNKTERSEIAKMASLLM